MISVVIPSKTSSNLLPCYAAVRDHQPDAQVIVVDDGCEVIPDGTRVVRGVKPFVYARNCNLGIDACDGDVVLLNDDAILETQNGLAMLADVAKDETIGLVAPTTNVTGLREQWRRGDHSIRFAPKTVPFICAYIPRRVIDKIGLLDERYTAYGWEDNDYCRRIINAGMRLAIVDDVYVDHGSLKSTFRGNPKAPGDIEFGRRLFMEKWGSA